MEFKDLNRITPGLPNTETMPALFIGHGSPMNTITENDYTRNWQQLGRTLSRPAAVLCISAHWETKGTFVTAMPKPKTIHDFYGFPKALFDVEYPAPGSPHLAMQTKEEIKTTGVGLDNSWGLDHGCWSVLKHVYPNADVPVVEMSLDYTQHPLRHFELAKELRALRKKGVLIIGSGNMVHNLRLADFYSNGGFDWAIEASDKMKKLIAGRDFKTLANYGALGKEVQLAVPTPEHYLPMLYALGLAEKNEEIAVFNDKAEYGALTMTSLKIG